MSLLNPVGLAANLISYGMTGNSLLANVADGILKNTAGISYDEAVARATQAIKQAGSGAMPQPAPQMGGTVQPTQVGVVGAGSNPINANGYEKADFGGRPVSPMRYDDQTVSVKEQRRPAMS